MSSISAVVGPSICADCYQVDSDCAEQLMAVVPTAARRASSGHWHADVGGSTCSLLERAGVAFTRIDECTFTNPNLFSYRRDHVTGRQGATIVLRSNSVAS